MDKKRKRKCCKVFALVVLVFLISTIILFAVFWRPVSCALKFQAMSINATEYENLAKLLSNESVLTYPYAGTYVGLDNIFEYVQFGQMTSPYLKNLIVLEQVPTWLEYNWKERTCTFAVNFVSEFETDNDNSIHSKFRVGTMTKVKFNAIHKKVETFDLHYSSDFLKYYVEEVLSSYRTKQFICDTLSQNCSDIHKINESPTREVCIENLRKLPTLTNGSYIDGLSLGCRVIHSQFARNNPKHCPHISFIPVKDDFGDIKCQVSKKLNLNDYFSEKDFNLFYKLLESKEIDPKVGYKIVCSDSLEWILPGTETSGCSWVAEDPVERCKNEEAKIACRASCDIKCTP